MVMDAFRARLAQRYRAWSERGKFEDTSTIACDCAPLAQGLTSGSVGQVFRSDRIDEEWHSVESEIALMGITELAGGVNPGDRRALYYLVRHFGPHSVLEIGTHIGASTVHIAAALRKAQEEDPQGTYRITSVDITDVNDRTVTPWLRYGSTYSPAEMAERLGVERQISFVTRASFDYFASCNEGYDFIFLDGDHAPRTVYQEIPAALGVLRTEGVILLHDYFPDSRPLWSARTVIQGPWLATERLRSEGARFRVVPLGELPWSTKFGSRTTSLALVIGV